MQGVTRVSANNLLLMKLFVSIPTVLLTSSLCKSSSRLRTLQSACPSGKKRVTCLMDPCTGKVCDNIIGTDYISMSASTSISYVGTVCQSDYCGACNFNFYKGLNFHAVDAYRIPENICRQRACNFESMCWYCEKKRGGKQLKKQNAQFAMQHEGCFRTFPTVRYMAEKGTVFECLSVCM